MSILKKRSLLLFGLILITLVGLPMSFYVLQRQQDTRSRAERTAVLSFSPSSSESSPVIIKNNDYFALDLMVNPGANLVSTAKVEILYDPTKLAPTNHGNPFVPNLAAFSHVIEGPVVTSGKISATLSIGTDLSKAIQVPTRMATVYFVVLDSATTPEGPMTVTYGPGTQILSISPNSSPSENVVSSTIPANILIAGSVTPIYSPTPTLAPSPTTIPTPTMMTKCPDAPNDTMFIIDKSGSMSDRTGTQTKIAGAKTAAKNFINIVSGNTNNRIGLISFSSGATLNSTFTNSFSTVKNQIDSLSPNGYTCHQCAINKMNSEFTSRTQSNMKKVVILLTDGRANWIEGSYSRVDSSVAERKALDAVKNAYATNKIIFYTIGLGNDVNENFLKQVASLTGGKYYFSPTSDQLNDIYNQISQVFAKGSISGNLFADQNSNGVMDSGESLLSGWTLLLTPEGGAAQNYISGQGFSIGGLCDGKYNLKEVLQSGWQQTVPTDTNGYTIDIVNGSVVTNKNFGNFQIPSPTPLPTNTPVPTNTPIPPSATPTIVENEPTATNVPATPTEVNEPTTTPDPFAVNIALDLVFHGEGSGGDNANPTANSMSNKNPLHPNQVAKVQVLDANNVLLSSGSGTIVYSSESGSFKGTVPVSGIANGNYLVKVTASGHLTRLIPGIQSISLNGTNALPQVDLITGDVNNDNRLDIRDYNLLLDCYSDLNPAPACNDTKKISTDTNDDGAVNQFDYNLFLREISTQPGQ